MNDRVRSLLADPVTAHMRTDPATFTRGQTVADALAAVRLRPPGGRIVYFYVVDAAGRLCGVVPTRRLLLAGPDSRVDDVMVRAVVAVPATATVLEACEFFTLHKLLAFPVVDENRRLVGLVDVELYTGELADIERRADNEDVFQLVGVHLTAGERKSVRTAVKRRFPWLLCNIAGGLLAGALTDVYADVSTLATVTPFIPVLLALAESVAIQSVSLSIQSLHGERPQWRALLPDVGREGLIGLALGVGCGLTVGLIAVGWKKLWAVGLSLLGGVTVGMAAAAAVGLAMPVVLRLLRRDPSVASGPIALAVADMITLLTYFNLARLLVTGG
jgi:magnesium transporter